jgi:hypothetical protein
VACSNGRGIFLVQKALFIRPKDKNQQNLLKIEFGISNAELKQVEGQLKLNYKLHLTVRLCKVLYVDCKNFSKIGEQ